MIVIEDEFKKETLKIIEKIQDGQKFYVDRVEDNIIVCEDTKNSNIYNINKNDIPFKVKENDTIEYNNSKFILNKKETVKRKKYIDKLVKDLWI